MKGRTYLADRYPALNSRPRMNGAVSVWLMTRMVYSMFCLINNGCRYLRNVARCEARSL